MARPIIARRPSTEVSDDSQTFSDEEAVATNSTRPPGNAGSAPDSTTFGGAIIGEDVFCEGGADCGSEAEMGEERLVLEPLDSTTF